MQHKNIARRESWTLHTRRAGLESGWHLAAGQLLLLLGNYSLKLQSSSDTISIQFLQLRETEMTERWWSVTRKKYKWQIMAFSPWASLGSPGAWCHSLSGEFQIMSVCQSRSLIDWWYDGLFILRCLDTTAVCCKLCHCLEKMCQFYRLATYWSL